MTDRRARRASHRLESGIDQLDIPRRLAYLAEQARQLTPDELAGVVHTWGSSNLFYRRAAIHLAAAARRADLLVAFVNDPTVGPSAISAAVRAGAAATIAAQVDDLPTDHRRAFYRALRKANLTDVADALIDQVRMRFGDVEAARLVGLCSVDVAARHLPGLVHRVAPGGRSLAHLAARAPDLVAQTLVDLVGTLPLPLRLGHLARYSSVLEALAATRPTVVFDLVGPELPWYVTETTTVRLARADAPRLAQLLIAQTDLLTRAVARVLWNAGAAGPLARHLWTHTTAPVALHRVLRAAPPSQRAALLEDDTQPSRTEDELTPAPVGSGRSPALASFRSYVHDEALGLLPHSARHDAARHHLALCASDHQRRLVFLAHLPVAQVRDELTELTRRPDPDQRIEGYRTLLRAAFAERDDDVLTDVLTSLTRLSNEQDPVRLAVACQLEAGFRGRLVPESVRPWLDQFVTAVGEARDTSHATTDMLLRLVRTSLDQAVLAADQAGTDWALDKIDSLLSTRHGVLDVQGLSRSTIDVLLPRLDVWLGRWAVARRLSQIRQLHRLRQPQVWDATAAWLRQDALATGDLQRQAIALYLDDPRFRADRAAEIVAAEPSTAYLGPVAVVLAKVRTDLLDPYLVADVVHGRFATSGTFFTPPLPAVRRWLPRQQQRYARALATRMGRRANRPMDWACAARLTAWCETAGSDRLDVYLAAGEVVEVEAGLGVLARALPPAEAAAQLLSHAGTDRARVALYALGRALRRLAPSQVGPLLRPYLLGEVPAKVTSRKALVHLADEIALPGTVDLLLATLRTPGMHRDVRFAAVRVLTASVDHPDVAQALGAAAASDTIVASALLNTPITEVAPTSRNTLGGLLAPLLGSPEATVRADARHQYPRFALWAPAGNVVLADQLRDPSWAEWHATATALGKAAALGVVDEVVALADDLTTWAVTEAGRDIPPSIEADLPGYRRLRQLVGTWSCQARPVAAARAVLGVVVSRLSHHEATEPEAVDSLVRSAFLADPPHLDSAALDTVADLCDRSPWLARLAAGFVSDALFTPFLVNHDPPPAAELLTVAQRHVAGPAAAMVVPLVRAGGETSGWSSDWTRLLVRLRTHDDPAVRATARFVDISRIHQ